MDLFEYQGKLYFKKFGIPVSDGGVADSLEDAVKIAEKIGFPIVVKAQVQVGGRGKAGGIKIAENMEELKEHFSNILGMDIKGHIVKRVWLERSSDISEEYYASFTLNRSKRLHLCMLSAQGGVEIEKVADENPDAIVRLDIDPSKGLDRDTLLAFVKSAKLNPKANDGVVDILEKLYDCFVKGDADLVEINPLILTTDDRVHALDAKVSLDDDAAFRHEEWNEYKGLSDADDREKVAHEKGLNYIGLDGTVGVIANGAGLAMSTCDVVNQVGGSPANFLDIGGGANADLMASALEVINSDPKVKSILVNIFGGIVRCDEVAKGIVTAMGKVDISSPIVIRLDGTNAEIAKEILNEQQSEKLVPESTMLSAAKRAVELAK